MARSTVARLGSRKDNSPWVAARHGHRRPAADFSAGVSDVSASASAPSTARWQVAAIFAAMAGLGILAWMLHKAREEVAWLERSMARLTTVTQASLDTHAATKRRLADTNASQLALYRYLSQIGKQEETLQGDLRLVRAQLEQAVLRSAQETDARSVQSAVLRTSLQEETLRRQETQQTVAQLEGESHRLASVASTLENSVLRLRTDNQALAAEVERQRAAISTLESENASLRSCHDWRQQEICNLRGTIGCLETRINGLLRELHHLRCH